MQGKNLEAQGRTGQQARGRVYERFNIHQRIQHMMMFSSFILLALSGLPIKYNETGWAKAVTSLFGGFDQMFTFHLIGASVMLLSCVYHVVYLMANAVRGRFSFEMVPTLKDVRDLMENLYYFVGLSNKKPRFGRYSYKEKFDYWAVFWGIAVMAGSGLIMWFPAAAANYFPRWMIDAARVAHSDEAMLAILAIFVWHFYNVHFTPDTFPLSLVWLHGKVGESVMAREHPVELEALRAREAKMLASGGMVGQHSEAWRSIPIREEAKSHPAAEENRWANSKPLIITELIAYAAVLAWFLYRFIPLGIE